MILILASKVFSFFVTVIHRKTLSFYMSSDSFFQRQTPELNCAKAARNFADFRNKFPYVPNKVAIVDNYIVNSYVPNKVAIAGNYIANSYVPNKVVIFEIVSS